MYSIVGGSIWLGSVWMGGREQGAAHARTRKFTSDSLILPLIRSFVMPRQTLSPTTITLFFWVQRTCLAGMMGRDEGDGGSSMSMATSVMAPWGGGRARRSCGSEPA